jgi:hypothetical protein
MDYPPTEYGLLSVPRFVPRYPIFTGEASTLILSLPRMMGSGSVSAIASRRGILTQYHRSSALTGDHRTFHGLKIGLLGIVPGQSQ